METTHDDLDAPRCPRVAYKAKLERARTMLATLSTLLDDHALEHVRSRIGGTWLRFSAQLNDLLGRAAAAIEKDRT